MMTGHSLTTIHHLMELFISGLTVRKNKDDHVTIVLILV